MNTDDSLRVNVKIFRIKPFSRVTIKALPIPFFSQETIFLESTYKKLFNMDSPSPPPLPLLGSI